MWGSKIDYAQQGLHGRDIHKLGAGDTPKIHASDKGQSWGSTNMPFFSRVNEQMVHEHEALVMNE